MALVYPRRTVTPPLRTRRTARFAAQRWRRAVLALALSLLVFAQQGFVLHALSHLSPAPLASPSSGTGDEGKSDNCGLCLAFAALASTAPGSAAPDLAIPATTSAVASAVPRPAAAAFTPGYRSRAPPRLA